MPTEQVLAAMREQRLKAYLTSVNEEMLAEREIEDAYADELSIDDLVPGAVAKPSWAAWRNRNKNGPNPFRRAIDRLTLSITTAEPQWEGDEEWPTTKGAGKQGKPVTHQNLQTLLDLIPFLSTDAALKGKLGVLPWRDDQGRDRVSILSGFTLPVWDDYDVTRLEKLLCFTSVQTSDGTEYLVWELEAGVVRIYEGVKTIASYRSAKSTEYPQRHAPDRIPAAYRVLLRDGNRAPEGFASAAISAFRQYKARLIQENASFELVGMPQRVAKYGPNGETPDEGDAINDFAPYKTIIAPGGIEYPYPADALERLTTNRLLAAEHVARGLHAPEPTTGVESGEARMVALEELVHASSTIANAVAAVLSEASELMAALKMLPGPVRFTITPEFSSQRAAAQQNLIAMYDKGILSKYETLLRLQTLGVDVSQAELDLALQVRDAQAIPPEPQAGELPPEMRAMQAAVMGGANANQTEQPA